MPTQTTTTAGKPPAKDKPPKQSRRDLLHVAYRREGGGTALADVVVFGTRQEALEYALEHDCKVVTAAKGQPVHEAIGGVAP